MRNNEKLKVEYKSTSILVPYAKNSRTHSDDQVDQIRESIDNFGFTNPILIDECNGIIAGHGRVLAANKIGMKEVPCIVLAGLSEVQKRAYVIADNKIALNAGWDDDMLKIELSFLDDMDFDLELTGFSDEEIDGIIKQKCELKEKKQNISAIKKQEY